MVQLKEIVLIPLAGMKWMAERIRNYIREIDPSILCREVDVDLPRFMTGDAKAVLQESVRDKDVFIIVDVGNHDCTYRLFDYENHYSPDDHFQNLVRTVSAIGGKASRITAVMPLLYSARQDRRTLRESLDCAVALQHLASIGVHGIMSFDVHDDRVQNAVPFVSFDNLMPTYQVIKTLHKHFPDVIFDDQHLVSVSPDFGGANRNLKYASELGLELGLFYKRRNLNTVKGGKNEILMHKYLGPDVKGKDVLIADDIIASGESMLDSAAHIKAKGARRVFIATTFGFFTSGVESFNRAYEGGMIDAVFVTNSSYVKREVAEAPWFRSVDIVKYISYYIYSLNIGASVSSILDPHQKIQALVHEIENKKLSMV